MTMDQATDKMMAQHIGSEVGYEEPMSVAQGGRIDDGPGNR